MPSKVLTIGLLWAIVVTSGCFHRPSPHMPDDWPHQMADAELLTADPEAPRLQVIIAYYNLWPNHVALRLVASERPVIFWDPGGGYGRKSPHRERIGDLIIDGAPDIPTYLPFRWAHNDVLIEIFEWRLSDAEAWRMHHILLAGAEIVADPQIDFSTDAPAFFCASAISEFLQRYGAPTLHIAETTILPARLSRALYQQNPDRVLIFKRDQRPQIQVMTLPPHESDGGRMAWEKDGASEERVD